MNAAQRARSFGAQADLYDDIRPGYPDGVVAQLVTSPHLRVLDVGAGTGKLTQALGVHSTDVVAVEPDDGMRTVLAARLPTVDVRAGTAEALPVEDSSVDLVVLGQAWHWVEPVVAAHEAHRVLAPGGRLAMVWNLHDDREPWVAELDRLTASTGLLRTPPTLPALDGFAPGEADDMSWVYRLSPERLVDLTRTWSSVAIRPEEERRQVLKQVRSLVVAVPQDVQGEVGFPYVCRSWTYRRSAGA